MSLITTDSKEGHDREQAAKTFLPRHEKLMSLSFKLEAERDPVMLYYLEEHGREEDKTIGL
jgi:hypothetical protein